MAIGIPEVQRTLIADHVRRCSQVAPALRWVSPANLHLTLRFIGQTSPELLERLRDGLAEVPLSPFQLGLGGAGMFGRRTRARVCWLGVNEGRAALHNLADGIEMACRATGVPAESREYNAHLTLARAREREGVELPELPAPPAIPPWRVEEFSLYQSHLGGGGPTYEKLETFSI